MSDFSNGGIGGHTRAYRGRSDDWITPKFVIDVLGSFDLDPCASVTQPWPTAVHSYTIDDDGFSKPWYGRVWMNPPYGPATGPWLQKLADHGDGIALIFARTETEMFFNYVWDRADSILFLKGRLFFHKPDGKRASSNSGGPSCLVAYGIDNTIALEKSGLAGRLVRL